jgi:hypothetical protein
MQTIVPAATRLAGAWRWGPDVFSNLTELTMGQGYRRFFRVVPALSDALRAENYRIRHEVYCRDLGFEPLRSNSLEADDFDERSIHCLVQSVSTGAYVGCARLVLTDADTPQTPLPVEVTCAATLDRSQVEAMARDRSQDRRDFASGGGRQLPPPAR